MAERRVYRFQVGEAQGDGGQVALLGGKGAGLAEMSRRGLPVPPGFTLTTEAWREVRDAGGWSAALDAELDEALSWLEATTGKRLGDPARPLLVSVRSGAAVSMPGMMDTILNLGATPAVIAALAARPGLADFAAQTWRRLLHMFGDVVLQVGGLSELDDAALEARLREAGAPLDDPRAQLRAAIDAVFRSFDNPRAIAHRKLQGLSSEGGTAATVQAMVFGHLDERSGTGVLFTRDPKTGARALFGEWLPQAQGEDIVAGLRTPRPIAELSQAWPEVYDQLAELAAQLERSRRDMQDIEFTVESGALYLLQTRDGKRTSAAALRIAAELVDEGLISEDEALRRLDARSLEAALRPVLDPAAPRERLARGLDASPGAAVGRIALSSEAALELVAAGEPAILVRRETSPEDIQGMAAAEGILTAQGGQTSHAAVVARGMGKPCIVGCDALSLTDEGLRLGATPLREGDWLSLDGGLGEVYAGRLPTITNASAAAAFERVLSWADARARLTVKANADTGEDARRARELGARGIGLCRTEHMFFQDVALQAMRAMLIAEGDAARREALARILPLQRSEFEVILEAMAGLPVTIRLLDPPLHEFLPRPGRDAAAVARAMGVPRKVLEARLAELHESNPMLGHRGCRLGITRPEIYETQVRAIAEAAAALIRRGVDARPQVMIPLVGAPAELAVCREQAAVVIAAVAAETGQALDIPIGTMIELPRACLLAREVAVHADFFSFGTNDLTQMTFGYSRDDIGVFLSRYLERGILAENPLARLDTEGVGELVRIACERGREAHPALALGACGEHAGDPSGVAFFHAIGLDSVSCSPFRVPVARLAAAQAALAEG